MPLYLWRRTCWTGERQRITAFSLRKQWPGALCEHFSAAVQIPERILCSGWLSCPAKSCPPGRSNPESLLLGELLQSWTEPSREGQEYLGVFFLALCCWFRTAQIFQRSCTLSPRPVWTPAMSKKISDASSCLSLAKWSRSSRLNLTGKRVQLAQS